MLNFSRLASTFWCCDTAASRQVKYIIEAPATITKRNTRGKRTLCIIIFRKSHTNDNRLVHTPTFLWHSTRQLRRLQHSVPLRQRWEVSDGIIERFEGRMRRADNSLISSKCFFFCSNRVRLSNQAFCSNEVPLRIHPHSFVRLASQ